MNLIHLLGREKKLENKFTLVPTCNGVPIKKCPCPLLAYHREIKRLMEQKKTVSTAKSVTAAVPLQSIKLQIRYLHPFPQFPGETTLRIQQEKSRYRLSPAKTSL